MKIFFLLFSANLIMMIPSFAQKSAFSFTPPEHYSVLDTASGDLNTDGYRDYIVILKNEFEKYNSDTTRPLLILFGNKENKLNQFARNDSVVLCHGCGGVFGDPYQGITIKNNYFSIDHYGGSGWRWTRHITFRYVKSKNAFILHKDGGESFHASNPEKTESFFRNKDDFGKLPFTKFAYDKK